MKIVTLFFSTLILVLILLIILVRWYFRICNGEKKLGKQERLLNAANQTIADQRLEIIALKKDIISLQRSLYNTDPIVYKIRTFNDRPEQAALSEQEWHAYLSLLEDIFHFISRLKHDYVSLTDNDIRICALLKEGVQNRHIASIMALTQESLSATIENIKHEKMNLEGQQKTLEDIMKAF